MKKVFLVLALLFCPMLLIPQTVAAQTVIFSDTFSTDLSNWHSAFGDWESWNVTDGAAFVTLPTSFQRSEITPNIAWNPEWQHYKISFDYYIHQGVDKNINFGFSSGSEWYEVQFTRSQYYIRHAVNNMGVWKEIGAHSLLPGQLYEFDIELNAGQIKIWIDDSLLLDTIDPTYSGTFGKPTLKATTGSIYPTKVSFDNYTITLLQPTSTTFPVLKQTDSQWALQEYDTASTWDNVPTIERWGCALTSLAMILRHHGITQLSSGTELNPSSLNQWLNNQPDGYIGEGLVNWIAAMRLVAQIAPQLGTPKLEYQRHLINPHIIAESELAANLPVILQIPGHFLVGHALQEQDISIADPAYNYNLLSEHQTNLLSTRTFTPSNTDLSYILLVHSPKLNVQINPPTENSILSEQLTAAGDIPAKNQFFVVQEIAKPTTNTYTLAISQAEIGPFELQAYLYDAQATVKPITLTGIAGPTPLNYQVNYNKEAISESNTTPIVSFAELQSFFELFFTSEQITYTGLFHLGRYLSYAVAAETTNTPEYYRYTSLLSYYLQLYEQQLSDQAKQFIQHYLSLLEQQFATDPV